MDYVRNTRICRHRLADLLRRLYRQYLLIKMIAEGLNVSQERVHLSKKDFLSFVANFDLPLLSVSFQDGEFPWEMSTRGGYWFIEPFDAGRRISRKFLDLP